jgi:formylmethanofuran--tetrahydromethanopterin N-formyltransferase
LKGVTNTQLDADIASVMEIVVNGIEADDVQRAMRAGIAAICALGSASGVRRISAGNYGGKLGQFHFHLREVMA